MNKLEDPKQILVYNEMFDSIYPIVSDHIGANRRFKSKKYKAENVDFSEYDAYAGALGSNYIVIDIDNKKGMDEGSAEWDTLLIKLKLYKDFNSESHKTFSHKTKSEGLHLFFKMPPGIDKSSLPTKIGDNIEIKKEESYLAGSYVETKGKGGTYSLFTIDDIAELPASLLGNMLSVQINKKKGKDKKETLLTELGDNEEYVMGNNEINWEDISYEEIKARMLTRAPNVDYAKWQYEMYLFIAIYYKLRKMGKELDTTCEDFLITWSAKGVNAGKEDATIIKGLVRGFDPAANSEKLLAENNFLIQNYNSATAFESYAKLVVSKLFKLKKKKATASVIKSFIESENDMLASKLIEDIKTYRECFMIHKENKTDIITLLAFTTKNRWEKLGSNASARKVRDPLLLETLFDVLLKDGQTLYSNYLRKYCEIIFTDLTMLGKFADKFLMKIKTSLYNVDLSSRRMPSDCDIMAFKNTAIKIQKNPIKLITENKLENYEHESHVVAISWENVRSHRLMEDIYMSNQSISSEDYDHFINRGIMFDTKQLKTPLNDIAEEMGLLFAPMFWNFDLPYYNDDYESYKKRLDQSARDRVLTFFSATGKAMLRYKNKIAPMFLILSGDEKAQDENGGNGKSFLGSDLLPTLFGRSKIFSRGVSNSNENKDKFMEASLVGAYIQILDDMDDTKGGNSVNVKHLIKKVGHRQSDVRDMQRTPREVESFYDTILMANNVDKRMASDAGNKRRIKYMIFYNSNKRCNSGEFEDFRDLLDDHKAMSTDAVNNVLQEKDQRNPFVLEEKRIAYTNKALTEAYTNFFYSGFVEKLKGKYTIADNIYFTYIGVLAEIFGANMPEICTQAQLEIRTKAFIYSINLGNKVLQAGTFDGLKGFSPFEIEDIGTPIYNILKDCIKIYTTTTEIGLPIDKRTLINFISTSLFADVSKYRKEIYNFVNELPILAIDDSKNSGVVAEFINIKYMDIGAMVSKVNKDLRDDFTAKINNSMFAFLQTNLNHDIDCSPFRDGAFYGSLSDRVISLLNSMGLKLKIDHIKLYLAHNKGVVENNWLRIKR